MSPGHCRAVPSVDFCYHWQWQAGWCGTKAFHNMYSLFTIYVPCCYILCCTAIPNPGGIFLRRQQSALLFCNAELVSQCAFKNRKVAMVGFLHQSYPIESPTLFVPGLRRSSLLATASAPRQPWRWSPAAPPWPVLRSRPPSLPQGLGFFHVADIFGVIILLNS